MTGRLRHAFRSLITRLKRFVHHRDEFVVCGAFVDDHLQPAKPPALAIDGVSPDRFDDLVPWSPYLSESDIEDFRVRDTAAVAIRDGETIAAINFFVRGPGSAFVEELGHEVPLADGEHFSCRTFVDPTYRGSALFEHMIWWYSRQLPPTDRIWGLVMVENTASLRSLSRNGWVDTGRWTAVTTLGRTRSVEASYSAKPLT